MRDIPSSSKMPCHALEFVLSSFRSFPSCYYSQVYVCNHAGSEPTDSSMPLAALSFLQF